MTSISRLLRSLSFLGGVLATSAATSSAALEELNVTFGGSGIPNDAVAVTSVTDGSYSFTLGLTAHQRYSNPALTNNALTHTFFAPAGDEAVFGSPGHQEPGYARWNFAWHIGYTGTAPADAGYDVNLLFDTDAGAGASLQESSWMNFVYPFGSAIGVNSLGDSWNMGMSDFNSGFNSSADGIYDFALVLTKDGAELGRSAITVVVGNPVTSVPDAASTLALSGLALIGLAAVARRR